MRERTWFRRLSEAPALASLPSIGENKRGLPLTGEDLFPEVGGTRALASLSRG